MKRKLLVFVAFATITLNLIGGGIASAKSIDPFDPVKNSSVIQYGSIDPFDPVKN